jgi:hypothetical protein
MKTNVTPLLKRKCFYEHESPSSLIYRLGVLNGYDEPWISQMISCKAKAVWGDWLNRIDDSAAINRIADLSLLKSEDVIRITIHYYASFISPNSHKLCLENIKAPYSLLVNTVLLMSWKSHTSKFSGSYPMSQRALSTGVF